MGTRLQGLLQELGGERRIDFALDRFKQALGSIGNPEQSVYTLIIGGTNGKGTTTLFVSSALTRQGFKVASFLSPHLQHPRERFLHNLVPIDEAVLEDLGAEFEPVARKFELTYFEYLTLLCFVWASRARVDFLVLEVGLGGRLDSTNVTEPIACAITNIAMDHEEYLGHSLESILEEKLEILRKEGLLFTHIEEPHLLSRVAAKCEQLDAIYYLAKDVRAERKEVTWSGQLVTLNGYPFELSNPSPGTVKNAALAFHLLRIVFPRISVTTLQKAFHAVKTPGRMEVVAQNPRVVLSGDHNPAGIQCLLDTLEHLPPGKIRTVCAFSPDKPYKKMVGMLAGISQELVVTQTDRHRGALPENYRDMGRFFAEPKEAVEYALGRASGEDTVLITGSLYLVGEVRGRWKAGVRFF